MGHPIDEKRCADLITVAKAVPNWGSDYMFDYRWQRGKLYLRADMRDTSGFMGRFGGGWQWALGFQASHRTLLIRLLVMTITISWRNKA